MSFLLLLISTLQMELEKSAEQVLPGREGAGGWRQEREMTQTMYAHVNK
jgi:hypothetical protein